MSGTGFSTVALFLTSVIAYFSIPSEHWQPTRTNSSSTSGRNNDVNHRVPVAHRTSPYWRRQVERNRLSRVPAAGAIRHDSPVVS